MQRHCPVALVALLTSSVLCAQTPFSEEAFARGVDFATPHGPSAGTGLALIDLDGDTDPDAVALGGAGGVVGIWENLGDGTFVDHSATSGIGRLPDSSGVHALDYDLDGDLDLFIARWLLPNVLLQNLGSFVFEDIAPQAGVDSLGKTAGCTSADYDGDGYYDLYVVNYQDPGDPVKNYLYRNRGDGTFEDLSVASGTQYSGSSWMSVSLDYDFDGDMDIYVSNDKGQGSCWQKNILYDNQGDGTFLDVGPEMGADICLNSMGVAVGDFTANGRLDLYCTNTPEGNRLLLAREQGGFVDAAGVTGTESFAVGWGAFFFDYNGNGFSDLYVCNMGPPNRLFVSDGSFPCLEVAATLAVSDPGLSFCGANGDVDGDGDLDLLVQASDEPLRLYINREGEKRNWVRFLILGPGGGPAIGARVEVRVGDGWRVRTVDSGTGFKSQNEMVVTFGLRWAETVDEIRVTWPDGSTRTLLDYPANELWTVVPTEQLGDGDGDGAVDPRDLPYLLRALEAGRVQPGLESMDLDGDGQVRVRDLELWSRRAHLE